MKEKMFPTMKNLSFSFLSSLVPIKRTPKSVSDVKRGIKRSSLFCVATIKAETEKRRERDRTSRTLTSSKATEDMATSIPKSFLRIIGKEASPERKGRTLLKKV